MTERKPPGVPFESWVDRQIRDGARRGGFDGLAGAGKPLPAGSDTSYDELWWIKEKMAREGLSVLPPTLALRKEAEDTLAEALAAPSERVVRTLVARINTRLLAMMLRPPPGPPLGMRPYDVEEVVGRWRERRAADGDGSAGKQAEPGG
ncbi:DUF1992 domain-containing protein [Streptomyces sp. NPDC005840]|uniref:DnaJ family domain-containing protein n=1 Tax=unclassified Streptomyces TaxID=2593676 RepID=UPI003405B3A1